MSAEEAAADKRVTFIALVIVGAGMLSSMVYGLVMVICFWGV
jgi:hypothetical protein